MYRPYIDGWMEQLPTLDNLYALSKLMGKPLDAFVVGAYAPDYPSIHIKEKPDSVLLRIRKTKGRLGFLV